jgi:predicted nucleic acid-binding Zn ribbon protein
MPHSGPKDLSSLLAGILHPRARPRALDRARAAWSGSVPPEISEHTRVASLRKGILTVEVDSPPLCHRLDSFERERLLLAVMSRPGGEAVTALRFRHGPGPD